MRFQTKYDAWLVFLLGLAAVMTCVVVPVVRIVAPGSHAGSLWLAFLPMLLWLIVIPCTLPQYYDLRADGLFLRQGWRKSLIPYASLIELQAMSDSSSAGVFSTDRIFLKTQGGRQFIIAVAEEGRFLDEISRRCPQLERRPPFGLGMPWSPPYII